MGLRLRLVCSKSYCGTININRFSWFHYFLDASLVLYPRTTVITNEDNGDRDRQCFNKDFKTTSYEESLLCSDCRLQETQI